MSSRPDSKDGRKPKGRPLSTMALSFASSLDNAFELRPEIETLSRSVARKRQSVSIQQSELQQLQARIRDAEDRLRRQHWSGTSTTLPIRRRTDESPQAFKKPALAPISSSDSGKDSESDATTSEAEDMRGKELVSEQDEDSEPERKLSETPAAPQRRPASQASAPFNNNKTERRSPVKRPVTSQVNHKRVASRPKA